MRTCTWPALVATVASLTFEIHGGEAFQYPAQMSRAWARFLGRHLVHGSLVARALAQKSQDARNARGNSRRPCLSLI
jgi:hypothetical protein